MRKLVVPVDFSAHSIQALKEAVYIGRCLGAEIHILHVNKLKGGGLFGDPKPIETEEFIQEKMSEMLREAGSMEASIHTHVRQGKVVDEITRFAEEVEAYLIIMGTHGISGFEEYWMGSNAYKVVSDASCPVMTMRSTHIKTGIDNIILPIDTSIATREKVPFAAELAKCFGATVHVLATCSDEMEEFVRKLKNYAAQTQQFLDDQGVANTYEMVVGNNVTDITIEYAAKVNADLICIMTEQETALGNAFVGPYAQQMVNHSSIPVLTVQRTHSANFSVAQVS